MEEGVEVMGTWKRAKGRSPFPSIDEESMERREKESDLLET